MSSCLKELVEHQHLDLLLGLSTRNLHPSWTLRRGGAEDDCEENVPGFSLHTHSSDPVHNNTQQ